MGFLKNTGTIELTAKLTPSGRKHLLTNSGGITKFTLGDSDNNYRVINELGSGFIPQVSGDLNTYDKQNGGTGYALKSVLKFSPTDIFKEVEPDSSRVFETTQELGYKIISGTSISQHIINLDDIETDNMVNLFHSFGLPMSDADMNRYVNTSNARGGFADTAFKELAKSKILVIGINGDEYGEYVDGKSLKITLNTTTQVYSIYSTYESKNSSLIDEDYSYVDKSNNMKHFGVNAVLLFSDDINKPNNDNTKSWSTGYAHNKPFSVSGKESFNFKDNPNASLVKDVPVGIAFLDKGFVVITNPTIVNNFDLNDPSSDETEITFNSVRNRVSQSITCIANRGEFWASTNKTWRDGDTPRITEIGLYNNSDVLVAIGKLNETYLKSSHDFVAFNITIDY